MAVQFTVMFHIMKIFVTWRFSFPIRKPSTDTFNRDRRYTPQPSKKALSIGTFFEFTNYTGN